MSLIKYIINRPIGVIMAFTLIIIIGIIASLKIPTSLLPATDIPKIDVLITNPELSPLGFEESIIESFRANLKNVVGLHDITSYSDDQLGKIEMQFEYGTDMDFIFFEVNEKVNETLSELNLEIERPKILKYNLSEIPSLYLSIQWDNTSKKELRELSTLTEKIIRRRFEQQPEIASVNLSGLVQSYVEIKINQTLLNSFGLSISEIKDVLRANNISPGNIQITDGHLKYSLSLESHIYSVESLKKILITLPNRSITLEQIAEINLNARSHNSYHYNQSEGISLAIIKTHECRENDFNESVNSIVNKLISEYPDLVITETKSNSIILNEVLNDLMSNLTWGLLFAVLVTVFFLRSFKKAFLVLLGVIISLVIDFLLFYLIGLSINIISLSGLILGIGLMVDNLIIVLDNIEQRVLMMKNSELGTVSGVSELIPSLASSTLTTCGIFVPLIFLSGITGILFFDQAIAVSVALVSSLVVCVILLPTLYYFFFKNSTLRAKSNPFMFKFYKRGYSFISQRQSLIWTTWGIIILLGIIAFVKMRKSQFPSLSSPELVFKIEWNNNYLTDRLIDESKIIINEVTPFIESSEFYVNQQDFLCKTQRNAVTDFETLFVVKLRNPNDREHVINYLTKFVRQSYQTANIRVLPEENALNSILVRGEYNLKIISYEKDITADIIQRDLTKVSPDLKSYFIEKQKGIEITISEIKLLNYRIDRDQLIDFIKLELGNSHIFSLGLENGQVPIVFSAGLKNISSFLNLSFRNEEGITYQLKDIIDLKHVEYKRGIEATSAGICDILYVSSAEPEVMIETVENIYNSPLIFFDGGYKLLNKLTKEMFYILTITLAILYLILSIQFESLRLPLIILIEIPIDIAFALIVLYSTGQTLNVMSFIGIIVMCGIVINDSILKIELIDSLKRAGNTIDTAISIAANRRLNSIMMTTSTAFLAVLPTFFQADLGSELQIPLIIALLSGLGIGTVFSIFMIPLLYKMIENEKEN